MPIYFFASHRETSVRAFTLDATGASLPAEYAPWNRARSSAPLPTEGDGSPVARAVQRDGFFLVTSRSKLSSGVVTPTPDNPPSRVPGSLFGSH
jgi:hypothetical protein